jgi:hypothetical protein
MAKESKPLNMRGLRHTNWGAQLEGGPQILHHQPRKNVLYFSDQLLIVGEIVELAREYLYLKVKLALTVNLDREVGPPDLRAEVQYAMSYVAAAGGSQVT